MSRLHLPAPEEMTREQRVVHDEIVTGVRGALIGPLRAVIHSPDLARRWSQLGEYLRFSTCLPKKLNELAIIVTGRHWNAQIEFLVHAEAARSAGLDPACIEAIRLGEVPAFIEQSEADIYEFARSLLQTGTVEASSYAAVCARWGARGVVELTALIGYYSMGPQAQSTVREGRPHPVGRWERIGGCGSRLLAGICFVRTSNPTH